MSRRDRRGGFTLVEVLVVLAIAGVLAGAVHRFLAQHRRFYAHVEAGALNHDALRVAWAVLAPDLREADALAGDVVLLAPDSLQVRSPVGFGVVCAADPSRGLVALLEARGRLLTGPDSLLVHGAGGWRVARILARDPAGPVPGCAYGAGTVAVLELEGGTGDLAPGDPLRAFRSWTYHPVQLGAAWWLARSHGADLEVLAGPLTTAGLRFRFLDAAGAVTSDPASVARVEIAARSESPVAAGGEPRSASLTIALRGRNR
ncbi:MAG TPA: prepilin-type N-terminal cleavage/methylation domain-containing protein [Longimicrobiales bacterium]|nr:prepilin-type N-terminal cleavage/methylation domain-containing protein [Longimicrobiales bacterium]